jgi:hypothetical protein
LGYSENLYPNLEDFKLTTSNYLTTGKLPSPETYPPELSEAQKCNNAERVEASKSTIIFCLQVAPSLEKPKY